MIDSASLDLVRLPDGTVGRLYYLNDSERIRLPDGRRAFVSCPDGVWRAWARAVLRDYGGNEYATRAPEQELTGIFDAAPRGAVCVLSFRDELCGGRS